MCIKQLIVLVLWAACCGLAKPVNAQETTQDAAYWTRLSLRSNPSKVYTWQTEIDNRRRFGGDQQQVQFIGHVRWQRRWGAHWETGLGGAYSNVGGRQEVRPYAEVVFGFFPGVPLRVSQRLRVERRWFFDPNDTQWRGRYRLQLEYPLAKKWRLRGSEELMWQHRFFDQNRVYGAVEWQFVGHWAVELGYLRLLQRRSAEARTDWSILRTTLYYTI